MVYDKLARVRGPRVHISLDVDKGDSDEAKELPFVMGVVSDLSGTPMKRNEKGELVPVPLRPLRDREFTEITKENFGKVMKSMNVAEIIEAENTIKGDGSTSKFALTFEDMSSFDPVRVAEQIPELKDLLDLRDKLKQLEAMAGVNGKLEDVLKEIMEKAGQLEKGSDN
jgi:type VI secretion system protein ImpB